MEQTNKCHSKDSRIDLNGNVDDVLFPRAALGRENANNFALVLPHMPLQVGALWLAFKAPRTVTVVEVD